MEGSHQFDVRREMALPALAAQAGSRIAPMQWQPVKFVLVGVSNTFVGLGTIYAMKSLVGLGDASSNLIGYGVGLSWSFLLNRSWTFEHREHPGTALVRFFAVALVAYIVNLATVLYCVRVLQVNGYLAQAVGIPPYTILFYFGCKHFAFRKPVRGYRRAHP
jgi:putative flippase GtrA